MEIIIALIIGVSICVFSINGYYIICNYYINKRLTANKEAIRILTELNKKLDDIQKKNEKA